MKTQGKGKLCLEYPNNKGDLCAYKGYLSKEFLSGLKWLGAYMSISAKCCNWDWIEIVTLSTCFKKVSLLNLP